METEKSWQITETSENETVTLTEIIDDLSIEQRLDIMVMELFDLRKSEFEKGNFFANKEQIQMLMRKSFIFGLHFKPTTKILNDILVKKVHDFNKSITDNFNKSITEYFDKH